MLAAPSVFAKDTDFDIVPVTPQLHTQGSRAYSAIGARLEVIETESSPQAQALRPRSLTLNPGVFRQGNDEYVLGNFAQKTAHFWGIR
jgi:hypothetical protein